MIEARRGARLPVNALQHVSLCYILRQSPLQRVDRNGPLQHGVVTAEHGPHRTFTQDRVDALSPELSNDRRFGHGSVVNVVFCATSGRYDQAVIGATALTQSGDPHAAIRGGLPSCQ